MLDEATSALDEMTAHRILNNLRLMTDKTVLLVTHRANQKFIFDKEFSFSKDGIQQIRRKGVEFYEKILLVMLALVLVIISGMLVFESDQKGTKTTKAYTEIAERSRTL